jgi:hypothetical protein
VKYELIVCCTLTPLQTAMYERFIKSKAAQALIRAAVDGGGGMLGKGHFCAF